MDHWDMIVLGGGPAGERAAIQAVRAGKRVVMVERYVVVGGTEVNWGAIPSKTLRETALFIHGLRLAKLDAIRYVLEDDITIADFMHRERKVVEREIELIQKALDRYGVHVLRGSGHFIDPHTVAVVDPLGAEIARLEGDIIVIATGSSPNRPADVAFDGETVFDSASILRLPRMPRSLAVIGAGVVGVEYASIFAALGLAVTLVDTREQLLPYLDREIAGILQRELERLGIEFISGTTASRIERTDEEPPRARCRLASGRELTADALLYAVGRNGNTDGLHLERVGIQPTDRGLIVVNEHFQTSVPHIYAAGDVIGYPALASTSMEQGRQAARHAFNIPGPRGQTDVLPFAIYSIPEVSYIGDTEEQLKQKGVEYVVGRGRYDMNPRGQILGATGGLMKLLFAAGSLRLLGAHVVGYAASELVHTGQAFLYAGADARRIAETLYNYPTLSDLYRHAALEALMVAGRPTHDSH